LLWFGLLLVPGSSWVLVLGTAAGLALSVWLCGEAERILRETDPPSVILDEITAMPVCLMSWSGIWFWQTGALPRPEQLVSKGNWTVILGVFAAFRFFDVLKPWPVRQSQALPGGWGITIDDVLAAIYVNVVVLLVHIARLLWMR
jgi:phosphatidylglycerophosphatase A